MQRFGYVIFYALAAVGLIKVMAFIASGAWVPW